MGNSSLTTYVLMGSDDAATAGDNGKGAFDDLAADIGHYPNVTFVYPSQQAADAARASHPDAHVVVARTVEDIGRAIQPPAHVIVACHGDERGAFGWGHDGGNSGYGYGYLYSVLPRGVSYISVLSCYGGEAKESLVMAQPGTLVWAHVGSTVESAGTLSMFQSGQLKDLNPVHIMISTLAEYGNTSIVKAITDYEKKVGHTVTPYDIFPHVIGIGGSKPQAINLWDTLGDMGWRASHGGLNPQKFADAVGLVKDCFDRIETDPNAINQTIDAVAGKIRAGTKLSTPDEMRIGLALGIAYLNTSGELERDIRQTIADSQAFDVRVRMEHLCVGSLPSWGQHCNPDTDHHLPDPHASKPAPFAKPAPRPVPPGHNP